MHECRSDSRRAAAEDEQLNIYKAEGQIAFIMVPKRPPTVSGPPCDDASKMVKHVFCFIPIISEGHAGKKVYYSECAESEIHISDLV